MKHSRAGFVVVLLFIFFFFSSRRRHTRSLCDWSSDVCSSDLTSYPSLSTASCRRVRHLILFYVSFPGRQISARPGTTPSTLAWLTPAASRTRRDRKSVV